MITYEIDIQKNELHVTINSDLSEAGVTLRYRQHQDQWQRTQDAWQCFHYAIRTELDDATVTAMLMSQCGAEAIKVPVTEELLLRWKREYHAARDKLRVVQ